MEMFAVYIALVICICTTVQAQDVGDTLKNVLERLQEVEQKQRLSEMKIAELTVTTGQQKALIFAQEERITVLEEQLQEEKKRTGELQNQVLANRRTLAGIHKRFVRAAYTERGLSVSKKSGNRIEKRQTGESLAFTAYLDHPVEYGAGQTIKFNKIVTNEGSAYNVHTGLFTCPESGLYLFSFAVWERMEGTVAKGTYCDLKVNDQLIVSAVVDAYHNAQDLQGGNSAVVRLNQGDVVWVSTEGVNHIHGGNVRATSFTGVYISN